MEERFAGTPSVLSAKILLHKAPKCAGPLSMMILGVKCALIYGVVRRTGRIELPDQDPKAKDQQLMGRLAKALYGARDTERLARRGAQGEEQVGFKLGLSTAVFQNGRRDLCRSACRCLIVWGNHGSSSYGGVSICIG